MEEPMKQKLEIKIISITVLNLIQIQNLDLSEYLLIGYPILKDFPLFILQYIKKIDESVDFDNVFFSLVRIRTNRKNFNRSKFQNLN